MADLRDEVRWAYERARLEAALPWAVPALALGMLAAVLQVQLAIVPGIVLAALVVLLRWRGQDLGRGVAPGLFSGLVGYGMPLFWKQAGACCTFGPCSTWCMAVCASGGLLTGVVLARAIWRGPNSWSFALSAASVAGLTATMGCLSMGSAGLVGVAAALALVGPVQLWRGQMQLG